MVELKNYCIVDNDTFVDELSEKKKYDFLFVNPKTLETPYHLIGEVYGLEGFKDGAFVVTSPVTLLTDDTVYTSEGISYKLGEMNPDYKEYLEAIEQNIPIVEDWSIDRMTNLFYFHSQDCSGERFSGKIISHEGNKITLRNGKTVFVLWNRPAFNIFDKNSSFAQTMLERLGKEDSHYNVEPIKFPEDFCEFAGFPHLHPKFLK